MRQLGLVLVGIVTACEGRTLDEPAAHFDRTVYVEGDLHLEHGAPLIELAGDRGAWLFGIDTSNHGGARDLVLAAKRDWPTPGDVADVLYMSHNDAKAP